MLYRQSGWWMLVMLYLLDVASLDQCTEVIPVVLIGLSTWPNHKVVRHLLAYHKRYI